MLEDLKKLAKDKCYQKEFSNIMRKFDKELLTDEDLLKIKKMIDEIKPKT